MEPTPNALKRASALSPELKYVQYYRLQYKLTAILENDSWFPIQFDAKAILDIADSSKLEAIVLSFLSGLNYC